VFQHFIDVPAAEFDH